ncbi:MAG: 3-oxoacyl-ACP synthase [Aquificota bacterium]|nr:MAG: 3-oxoacyl-ACP synthase [Aquificota bacterium]
MAEAYIKGIGTYAPQRVMTNFDWEKLVDTTNEWIIQRTGIKERRIAAPEEVTSDLGAQAAKEAMEAAGVSSEDIDLLICATASPDTILPSTACWMQPKLGLEGKPAFDISAACSGFAYGLAIAEQFVRTGKYRNVLVVGAEMLSRMMDWKDRSICVLLADGAGAAVVSSEGGGGRILGSRLHADGTYAELLWLPAGGTKMPASHETVDKRLHYYIMKGNELFKIAVKSMADVTRELLEEVGLSEKDIDWIIPHQANIRILQSLAKRLRVSWDRVVVNIERYGNTSAASIPLAWDEALKDGRIKRGDRLLLVSFGGGLTWSAILVEW